MIDSIKQKLEKLNNPKPTSFKKAGVLIGILYFDEFIEDPHIVFTKRSTKVSTHSGEVSFPGGKWEEGDEDLYQTSLRESFEEINLTDENITKLGSLNYLISRHKIEVNPFVGLITKKPDFSANEEIEDIFTVPFSYLLNKENAIQNELERDNMKIIIPSWVYNEQRIWGLTAMITAEFLNICFDADIPSNMDVIREKYDS
jgi:8-oxo-dGTP pyrophosphatase MutT (NUDIX family)